MRGWRSRNAELRYQTAMSTPLAPFRVEKLVPNTPRMTKAAAALPPIEAFFSDAFRPR